VALIDNFVLLLKQRIDAYLPLVKLFGFLHNLPQLSHADIKKSSLDLISAYPEDFESDLTSELLQFSSFLERNIFEHPSQMTVEARMFQVVSAPGLRETFPNVDLLMRIYLTILVTNCSGERSFSTLKRVKSTIRSSMGDDRLNNLSILCIENELTRKLDFKDVIATFAAKKARRVNL